MLDYDFRLLQPSEFECFSRDLLQARENILIESFADGRDKGIDLRFAYSKDKICIVQCKRYKDWKELKGKLKGEVEKVKRLSPQRYILTTSVDLTVNQKDEVIAMFSPYILNSSDVLGKKDLNNLLGRNPEIEKNYHKLWLASTNVLNTIVNRATLNWSSFELEKIEKDIRLYVENESLNKALDILKENHYVVISGIPGIGKTTLARMLVYTMLASGYEEFVYVTEDMDNAASLYDKEKRQIFFFDDFLGSNSFVPQSLSFENKLITFIEKVKNSKHALFVLSTREYVLSEAKAHYEKLVMSNIDIAKCTIELEYYTKPIKAKILYNHLAEANIPKEYINIFLDKRSYREIIEHRNFNPRVIEAIIKEQVWKSINPEDFSNRLTDFFDNPIKVWQLAFNNLEKEARYALLVLASMGNTVKLDDYEEAFRTFCKLTYSDVGLHFDDVNWNQSLKVLMDCFIKVQTSCDVRLVTMYNPSIADFVVAHLNSNSHSTMILLRGACYIEQLLNIFTDSKDFAEKNNLALVEKDIIPVFERSFTRIWEGAKSCILKDYIWQEVEKEGFTETKILLNLKTKYPNYCKLHEGLVEELYNREELTWQTIRFENRIEMINQLDWTRLIPKADVYLQRIIENEFLDADKWLQVAETIKNLDLVKELLKKYFYDKMEKDLESEAERFSDLDECEELYQKMDSLQELLPDWECSHLNYAIMLVEKRIKEEEDEYEGDGDDYYKSWKEKKEKEDSEIDEMFNALRVYD